HSLSQSSLLVSRPISFCLEHPAAPRHLHPFPTRRSSDLIVWPEHAVPRYLEDEPMLGAQLGAVAARRGADLLFGAPRYEAGRTRSEEHTSELQSRSDLVCRLLLEKKNVVLIAKSARCALT